MVVLKSEKECAEHHSVTAIYMLKRQEDCHVIVVQIQASKYRRQGKRKIFVLGHIAPVIQMQMRHNRGEDKASKPPLSWLLLSGSNPWMY